jgi:hypothetical protein
MKKLLSIIVLSLLLSGNAYAKTKLICQSILEQITGNVYNINFDEKTIDVFQGSGGNKLTFKVKQHDESWVISHLRSLLKGDTSYDTHVTDWNEWDHPDGKNHLWQVQIDRMLGLVFIVRSKKPWKEGKEEYKLEDITLGGMECKKSGLSGKF